MATDQDLMGLGLAAHLASRLADSSSSINVAAAGTSTTTGYQIRGNQFLVFVGSGSGWVALPPVGGSDNAPRIADAFILHNGLATSLTVGIPTGTTINIGGTAFTGNYTLTTLKTLQWWPISVTQLFGIAQ